MRSAACPSRRLFPTGWLTLEGGGKGREYSTNETRRFLTRFNLSVGGPSRSALKATAVAETWCVNREEGRPSYTRTVTV